ncbi:MAG: amidohydrolase, partial [Clostridiales bacterium]|nr:amidohydrolase [Clostridiales bacterium]
MILIENANLYDGEVYRPGVDVLIDGPRVAAVGAGLPGEGARVIDARGGLCLPGLNNAHTHAAMTLLRGAGSDLPLMDWLNAVWPLEDKMDGSAIYWGTMLAAAEMLRRGITSFADMYLHMGDVAAAVGDSGMRANLSRAVVADDGSRVREGAALFEEFDGAFDGRAKVYMAVHGEYTSGPDDVRAVIEAAHRLKTGVHIHLSETPGEVAGCIGRRGASPVKYFDDLGLFELPALAAHCVAVDQDDIEILARRGVWAVHNPASNLKLASGFMPAEAMRRAGVRLALGSDGVASNNRYDLFDDMRLAALAQKALTGDPAALPVAEVLGMATRGGALAMGFNDVGLVKPGMKADLILLDPD